MQTQSISLNVSAMQSVSTGKTTKAGNAVFDSFMNQNASQVSVRKQDSYRTETKDVSGGSEINSSKDEYNQHKISLTSNAQDKQEWSEVVDTEEVGKEIVSFLKETFGMSEEDIVDILEQLGLTPTDLAFCINPETNMVSMINVETIKVFVMEVHGVADANLFLTSDTMSGELNDIMTGIQNILEDALGMDLDKFLQGDETLLQSFSEKIEQLLNGIEEMTQDTADVQEQDVTQHVTMTNTEDEIPVVVEMSDESGLMDMSGETSQNVSQNVQQGTNESPINAFVERLSQAFDNVEQTEISSARVTMSNIVDQVVNHIRIRVLPQTTSMELQLNPESLGRVNLNVTSNNGVATATLTVQNEMAKEALESQLVVLRENLEEQGLKVDSVEVNVSEFGFKNPEDSNNQYQQKKSSGKRFRADAGVDEVEGNSVEETEERQSSDSVVDYTA